MSQPHISPVSTYLTIFGALLVLTLVTVLVAFQDFGALNTVIALAIACTKGVLVVLWFMHVKYSSRLTKLVVVSGFLWFLILVALTLGDYLTRGWILPA